MGDNRCIDCGTSDFSSGRALYEDGDVCGHCYVVRALKYKETDWIHGYKDNPTNTLKPVKLRKTDE